MSRALLLAPHNDDETLFAAYTILRCQPHVVTCLRSFVQASRGGPTFETRERETGRALFHLGCTSWHQLPVRDDTPDVEMLESLLRELADDGLWDRVYAPAVEDGGHEGHTLVGELAVKVFGDVIPYLTYRRGMGKSTSEAKVPVEPGWHSAKLRAMAEYESQIELESTAYWFVNAGLDEFYA